METTRIRLDPKPQIYKPLADLKYHYHQRLDRTSTIGAEAATSAIDKLPAIETLRGKRDDFTTKCREYVDTINDSFKIKLKCGEIADKISSMELTMRDEKVEYEQALSRHEVFVKSFRRFLDRQYDEVMCRLSDLQSHERATQDRRATFEHLQSVITEKSLKISEMENKWREYKRSELFLRQISLALQNDQFEPQPRTFNVDPVNDTPTLDERIANFETYPDVDAFEEENYRHVTAERYAELLAKLKRQNLQILGHKLRSERLKHLYVEAKDDFENDTKNRKEMMCLEIDRARTGVENLKANVNNIASSYEKAVKDGKESSTRQTIIELKNFVENLYEKCFEQSSDGKSHVQMAKYLEEYCDTLLSHLYSFDLDILRKVLRKNVKKK